MFKSLQWHIYYWWSGFSYRPSWPKAFCLSPQYQTVVTNCSYPSCLSRSWIARTFKWFRGWPFLRHFVRLFMLSNSICSKLLGHRLDPVWPWPWLIDCYPFIINRSWCILYVFLRPQIGSEGRIMKFLGHRLDAIWPYRGWTRVIFSSLTVPEAFCTYFYVFSTRLEILSEIPRK